MKHWKILVILAAVAALTLGTIGFALAMGPAHSPNAQAATNDGGTPTTRQGVVGTITSIAGGVLTMQTARGAVTITLNDATVYRMPPKGVVTLADVQQALTDATAKGEKVHAIVLAEKSGETLTAKTVAVVPPLPDTTHFVGKVTAVDGNTVTATNAKGETLTVTLPDASKVKVGQEIVLAIGPGGVIQRGMQGLKLGLRQEAQQFKNFAQRFRSRTQARMEAAVGGTIQSVDTTASTVIISARSGKTITLTVTANTKIRLSGQSATIDQLQAGDRVVAVYNSQSKDALKIVAGPAVPTETPAPTPTA